MERVKIYNQNGLVNSLYKVYIRLKPTDIENDLVTETTENTITIKDIPVPGKEHIKTQDISYKFDKIFEPQDDQQKIFDKLKNVYVPHLLTGNNVTLISYGPTGGGKSFTIFGEDERFSPGNFDQDFQIPKQGLVIRTIEYLLNKKLQDKDLNIDLSCNFVDIYMDKLRDLGKSLDKNKKNDTIYDMEDMEITEHHSGIPLVKNLKKISILSINDIYDLLQSAFKMRNNSQTKFNNLSSRTHTIFTVNVDIYDKSFGQKLVQLQFVDLAGSERVVKSINEGNKFQEEILISSNLLCLAKVFDILNSVYKDLLFKALQKIYQLKNVNQQDIFKMGLNKIVRQVYLQIQILLIPFIMIIQGRIYNFSAIQYGERSKNLDFKSKLLDDQMNIGQSQNLEKNLKQITNEINGLNLKLENNKKDYTNKLLELQKQLDINIDLNRLVAIPNDKDLKFLHQIRQAQEQLENLKQQKEQMEYKIQKVEKKQGNYKQEQYLIQEKLQKEIQSLQQKNNKLKDSVNSEKVLLDQNQAIEIQNYQNDINKKIEESVKDIQQEANFIIQRQNFIQTKSDFQATKLNECQQQQQKISQQKQEFDIQAQEQLDTIKAQIKQQFEEKLKERDQIIQKFSNDYQQFKMKKKQKIHNSEVELLKLYKIAKKQDELIHKSIKGEFSNGILQIHIPVQDLIKLPDSQLIQKLESKKRYNLNQPSVTVHQQNSIDIQLNTKKLEDKNIQQLISDIKQSITQSEQRILLLEKQVNQQKVLVCDNNLQNLIQENQKYQELYLQEWRQNNDVKIKMESQKTKINNVIHKSSLARTQDKFYKKTKFGII